MNRIVLGCAALCATTLLWCCTASSAERVGTMSRVAKQQPANLTRNSVLVKGAVPSVLTGYEIDGDGTHGAAGTIQPGVALFNANSGALESDRQINVEPNGHYTVATSGAGHDAVSLVPVSSGVLAVYGAISTYGAYHPPAAWTCAIAVACQPFKFAPFTNQPGTLVDRLAESKEYLMPTVGISEVSYAAVGDSTLIGGQQQPSSRTGESGAQGYVTFDARSNGGIFETAAGPWSYTAGTPTSDGLSILTATPQDDAYVAFGITSANPGSGSVALSFGNVSCSTSVQSNGDAATAAAAIADELSRCPGMRGRFGAMRVTYDPSMVVGGHSLAPAVVGITASDKRDLPGWSGVHLECSGTIACGSPHGANTVLDERLSGLHRHFLFGGLVKRGPYVYYLMDVEQVTGSWLGRGQSSLGLALACFRTDARVANGWQWTDCAGRHPFVLSPGTPPQDRLHGAYLIPAPASYGGGMLPYVDDWSMQAQARAGGAPVIAAVSLTQMPDGDLMFVHGCQTRARAMTVCYARFDPRTGRTRSAGTIVDPSGGGSLASLAARTRSDGTVEAGILTGAGDRWGCGGTGLCFLTYRYDAVNGRWISLGTASIGGLDSAAFPGTVSVEGDRFVVQMHRLSASGYDVEVQMRS